MVGAGHVCGGRRDPKLDGADGIAPRGGGGRRGIGQLAGWRANDPGRDGQVDAEPDHAHRRWCPPFGGGTHSALPLHDRGLCVVADEATQNIDQEQMKRIWMFDIRTPENPVSIATFPVPAEQDYVAKGGQLRTA